MAQIATKNLQYLNELLGSEKLVHAKLTVYENQVTDPQLKQMIKSFKNLSKSRYEEMFSYLKSHS